MKIATWNIERFKHKREQDKMVNICNEIKADILVLTETDEQIHLNYRYAFHTPKLSAAPTEYYLPAVYKLTENRVSIFTNYPCVKQHYTYDKFTALCIELQTDYGNLLVYGTIIGISGSKGRGAETFKKDLLRQCDDFVRLSEQGHLCICGDFNCSFADNYYFTSYGRDTLKAVFARNKITLLTKDTAECIDHIAISREFPVNYPQKFIEWNLDKSLSDHKGIMVNVEMVMRKDMLYVCKTPFSSTDTFAGFAIGLQIWNPHNIHFDGGMEQIGFHDTVHPHTIKGKITVSDDGTVNCICKNGEIFIFKPCHLEDYRREYYKLAENGKQIALDCKSDEELWAYYTQKII